MGVVATSLVEPCSPFLWVTENFRKREMFKRNYHGGSSSKRGPRLAIREPDPYQPRDAQVQPCGWPSDEFMIEEGFKDEFDALVRNVGLEEFISDKCD